LIKVVSELATGHRGMITVYGNDYDTADGTCMRDFIHVSDLAGAHVAALRYLLAGGDSEVMNCGYGQGYSVLSVLRTAGQIVGRTLPYTMGPRRAGDPAEVIANPRRIMSKLDWKPRHADLEVMLRSAIAWEEIQPQPLERAYAS
jgi:UDP-glucose 4-epimerase